MSATKSTNFLQASGIMLIMALGANIFHYLFHSIASRKLGPADYGALSSMLALLTIASISGQAIQIVLAKKIAIQVVKKKYDYILSLAKHFLIKVLIISTIVVVLFLSSSFFLKKFFRLDSIWPLWVLGITVISMLMLTVIRSLLQGFQYFTVLGLSIFLESGLRLGIGTAFILWGWGVSGALIGNWVSDTVVFILVIPPLLWILREKIITIASQELREIYRETLFILAVLTSCVLLGILDVIMVKHFFAPTLAGYYSAVALVGKTFLLIPVTIAQVMLPKVSISWDKGNSNLQLVWKSLVITVSIMLLGFGVVWFIPHIIIQGIFGNQFLNAQVIFLVKFIGLVVTPLGFTYILLQYNIVIKSRYYLILLLIDVVLLISMLILFHQTLKQVMLVVGINHLLVAVIGYLITSSQNKNLPRLAS